MLRILIILLFFPSILLADITDIENILPAGKHYGVDSKGNKCLVTAKYANNPDTISFEIGNPDCLDKNQCLKYWSRNTVAGGGGCFNVAITNKYIHYFNGKSPQKPPTVCSSRYTPGGIKFSPKDKQLHIERDDGNGNILADCIL